MSIYGFSLYEMTGEYLLSASLATAALPPVPQSITAASVLVGLNVLFRPPWVYQHSVQLALLLPEPRDHSRRG